MNDMPPARTIRRAPKLSFRRSSPAAISRRTKSRARNEGAAAAGDAEEEGDGGAGGWPQAARAAAMVRPSARAAAARAISLKRASYFFFQSIRPGPWSASRIPSSFFRQKYIAGGFRLSTTKEEMLTYFEGAVQCQSGTSG